MPAVPIRITAASGETFEYDGGSVAPGEREHVRFTVNATYVSDPIRIPVTIINGIEPGPTVFLSAAVHGDGVNGIESFATSPTSSITPTSAERSSVSTS